ncbi:MAG TPA: type IV pilus assembly protein PilM [Fimbriiglobus sp.]|jgi:type IV pilus assembly protein PilM
MALPTGYWGIDIGQCGLKALRLEMIDGQPTATNFDYVEHPKILSQPDAEPDQLTRQALETFLARNTIKGDSIAISVAGQSGLARFVKLPPVEEKKVADIVKFEAKQQIPFPLEEVVWDYQKIAGGEVTGGFAMETEIGLFAMKRDMISRYMGHFNGVGVEVNIVQMAPLALCNYATYELLKKGGPGAADAASEPGEDTPRGKKKCAVILDIGTDSSNLIITDGGKIIWQRPVPLGGNNFTRALTKEMKLTFAKAEHLKRNAAKSPDLAAILRALRPVLTDFVGEVQRSLGYFTSTHRDAHIGYMVGLGNAFKLPGLQKYLAEKLSLDVRKPTKVERLAGDQVLNDPVFEENVLTFPVAYGLALQGLDLARIRTNLLPPEIRTDRVIRAKKPWAAAAAAALLLGTGALATGYAVQLGKTADKDLQAARKKASDAAKLADAQDAAIRNKEAELEKAKNDVKAIVKGQDERLNWVRLDEVITEALPRPGDDGNLELPNQRPFWQTGKEFGDRALEKYRQRVREGVPADRAWEDDMSQYLARVNIEVVNTRYVPDLKSFLDNADNYILNKYGDKMFDEHSAKTDCELDPETKRYKPKAPEGGGWVVEIRGWTYHKDGTTFVKNTVLRNFQRVDKFSKETDLTKGDKPKVEKYLMGVPDPVKTGTMSHPFLLSVRKVDNPQPNQFVWINSSEMEGLITPAAGGGGATQGNPISGMAQRGAPGDPRGQMGSSDGGLPGGPSGMTGGRGTWTPISSSSSASGGAGGAAGGFGGRSGSIPGSVPGGGSGGGMRVTVRGLSKPGGGSIIPGGGTGSSDSARPGGAPTVPDGGIPSPGGGTPGQAQLATPKEKPRTEFVLCFIWREPTPTDTTPEGGASTGNTGG